ncbi:hypothetical protein Ami103574_13850 [Aminipila butyrica]|uniref:Uncharacterized protein n=1 Tax=Aminipila butyrica TaxID=433296 RepID=A0A858BYX6_9FIRM|nr:hypothetical protein [Aminipila butyrica]QIB70308.1 hypothetical protein Ami103574_13850 [Aminipila butyrica]
MKRKKVFAYLIVGLLLSSANCILNENNMVYASSLELNTPTENSKIISLRAAETEWRFRTVNGKGQKRLWSITYNKWLTDWEWVK